MMFKLVPSRREQQRGSGGYQGSTQAPAVSPSVFKQVKVISQRHGYGSTGPAVGVASVASAASLQYYSKEGHGRSGASGLQASQAPVSGMRNAAAAAVGVAAVARAA